MLNLKEAEHLENHFKQNTNQDNEERWNETVQLEEKIKLNSPEELINKIKENINFDKQA